MAYCYEHGIPHSEFLSWEPEDRAKIAAYAMEKSSRCPSCGTSDWEWEEDHFAYAAVRMVCRGCQLKDLVREDESATNQAGTSIVLLPKAAAEKLAEQTPRRPRRMAGRD